MRMHLVIALAVLSGCTKPDPWAPCRTLGVTGHRAELPTCSTPACEACVTAMLAASQSTASRDQQNALAVRFHTIAVGARDVFLLHAHVRGSLVYEHCTTSLAPGASCARYSPLCVGVLAHAMQSGDTPLAHRTQYNLAIGRACRVSRQEIVTALTPVCETIDPHCESASCTSCVSQRIAAMTVLAPHADTEDGAVEMQHVIDATPDAVARSLVEVLGGADAPTDIETVVVQRALRGYCFSLTATGTHPPPFACNAVNNRFLTHADFKDSIRAWDSLQRAQSVVRGAVLDALFVEIGRASTLDSAVRRGLLTLPAEATHDAVRRAMQSPALSDAMYAALREVLVSSGVTTTALPPVNRLSTPPTTPSVLLPSGGGVAAPMRVRSSGA
jgi:hypothetical protein